MISEDFALSNCSYIRTCPSNCFQNKASARAERFTAIFLMISSVCEAQLSDRVVSDLAFKKKLVLAMKANAQDVDQACKG